MKMKKLRHLICGLCLICCISGNMPGSASALFAPQQADAQTTAVADGWRGRQYYRDGQFLTGLHKISGCRYYFDKKGNLYTGWKTVEGNRYFFSRKGRVGITLGASCSGLKKIDGKWYFFSPGGILRTKKTKQGDITYYIDGKKHVEAYRVGDRYFKPNGKEMTERQTQDYKTLQTARKIVKEITNDQMTDEQKLRACFDWVMEKPYLVYRKFDHSENWTNIYANDHFERGGGDCHADGSAFAYLARALGYKDVYVCLDCNGVTAQGHCWTEINGKVYDPLFAQSRGFSSNYNVTYSVYPLHPILHLKIVPGYEPLQ